MCGMHRIEVERKYTTYSHGFTPPWGGKSHQRFVPHTAPAALPLQLLLLQIPLLHLQASQLLQPFINGKHTNIMCRAHTLLHKHIILNLA